MVNIVQFPEAFIELGREIHQHEDLMEKINSQEEKDFTIIFAIIAAHCDIVMDGIYTQNELVQIAEILIRRLKGKRTVLIVPDEYGNYDIH